MNDYMLHLDVTYDGPALDDDSIEVLVQRLPGCVASIGPGVLGLAFTATGLDSARALANGTSLASGVLSGLLCAWNVVGAEIHNYEDEPDH